METRGPSRSRTSTGSATTSTWVSFVTYLAQPLPHIPDWKLTARRLAAIHFDGLAGAAATATEQ